MSRTRPATATLLVLLALTPSAAAADAIDDELRVVRYRVTATRLVAPGLVEVDLGADIENTRGANFTGVSAQFTVLPGLPFTSAYPFLEFGDVGPHAAVGSTGSFTLQVARRRLPLLRNLLLQNAVFAVDFTGTEAPVGAGNLLTIDQATCSAFQGLDDSVPPAPDGTATYLFDETDFLRTVQPGDILTESGCRSCGVSALPWQIVSITLDGTTATVVALPVTSLVDLYENATFSLVGQIFDQSAGPNSTDGLQSREATECEDGQLDEDGVYRIYTPTGFFFRFNDVELVPGVKLSGSFSVGSVGFDVEIRIRDGAIERVALNTEVSQHLTLEATAELAASIPRTEHTLLLPFPLPGFHTNIGGIPVEVTPQISMYVGGEGDIAAGVVMGGVQSTTAHFEAAIDNGVPGGSATFDIEPLQMTPPQITTETGLNARLFGGVQILLDIDHIGGPTAKLEGSVDLDIDPSATPWWSLSAGAQLTAGLLFAPLGIELAEADFPALEAPPHAALHAPEGGDGIPGNRTSGTQQRWAKAFDIQGNDFINDAVVASDGSLIVTGSDLGNGYLMKLDRDGNPVFTKQFTSSSWADAVVDAPGVGYLVVGDTGSPVWAAMVDPNGALLWRNEYDVGGATAGVEDISAATILDPETGVAIGFAIAGRLGIGTQIQGFVMRLDTAGAVVWAKGYDLPDGPEEFFDIKTTSDGGFIASGYLSGTAVGDIDPHGGQSGWVVRLDADGNLLWSKGVGSSNCCEYLNGIAEAEDGGFVAVGNTGVSALSPHEALLLVKLTSSGDASWLYTYAGPPDFSTEPGGPLAVTGETAYDVALDVIKSPYGFVIAGRTSLSAASSAWLMRVDEEMDIIWWTTLDAFDADDYSVIVDAGDGLMALGNSKSFTPLGIGGDQDLLVTRLPYEGMVHYAPDSLGFTNYSEPVVKSLGGVTSVGQIPITAGSADVTAVVSDLTVTQRTATWTVNDVTPAWTELVRR